MEQFAVGLHVSPDLSTTNSKLQIQVRRAVKVKEPGLGVVLTTCATNTHGFCLQLLLLSLSSVNLKGADTELSRDFCHSRGYSRIVH